MNINYNYDRILIIGRSGSGKTSLVYSLTKKLPNYLVLTQKTDDFYPKKHIRLLGDDIDKSVNDFIKEGIKKSPITLIFEDLPSYIYTSNLPEMFRKMLINGRHIGIGMIFISQRYYTIPVLVRVQSNIHIYFQSSIDDYSSVSPDIYRIIDSLGQYQYCIVNYDNGFIGKGMTSKVRKYGLF